MAGNISKTKRRQTIKAYGFMAPGSDCNSCIHHHSNHRKSGIDVL